MLSLATLAPRAAEPNPPKWPDNVKVFSPGDDSLCASTAASIFATNGGHTPENHGQFVSGRYAMLFKPGSYSCAVPVGFYTQVLGLGQLPDDVTFTDTKGVYCEEGDYVATTGALDNFWRGAENFKSEASYAWGTGTGMLWAVSQAAPLRRVHVAKSLVLYEYEPPYPEAGFASGGFLADSVVDGSVAGGSQQQWFTRNSEVGSWSGGVWNPVFVGVEGAPSAHCGKDAPAVVVRKTPTVVEKPFISVDPTDSTKFVLNIPKPRTASSGVDWPTATPTQVGFEQVYVATAADSAATINVKLGAGLHVVLTPGIYQLEASLKLGTAGQVLLGLGLATLVAANGVPAISVANVDGVRVAGVLLQAGNKPTSALLQWGEGSYAGDAAAPGVLSDVFARVGGPDTSPVQAATMVALNSSHVIGDNLWLWRADHTVSGLVKNSENPCESGLVVRGDDVTMYGLAVEHTLGDLTRWHGERGQTYFYQSEMPYDATQANYGDRGYVGYRVDEGVAAHDAWGVGVYHFFRDAAVTVQQGIKVPAALEARVTSPLSVYLNGNGTMLHVINSDGNQTDPAKGGGSPAYWCGGVSSSSAPSASAGTGRLARAQMLEQSVGIEVEAA